MLEIINTTIFQVNQISLLYIINKIIIDKYVYYNNSTFSTYN